MLEYWASLHGCVFLIFLMAVNKGQTCEAPSSPECFRKNEEESVYTCEWSMNTTDSPVTFGLYSNTKRIKNCSSTKTTIVEELLITTRAVDIWVEAHVGNSSCTSPRRRVELANIVKYDAPQNIAVSWSKNNLTLSWNTTQKAPALAEVWFLPDHRPNESWGKRLMNTTLLTALNDRWERISHYQVILVNLTKDSAYQVQIRHRSNQVKSPLWSLWSPVVIAPAELQFEPKVNSTMKVLNGTREVTLTWEPMPRAAAAVTFNVESKMSTHGCPCGRAAQRNPDITTNTYVLHVSYAAVKITVTAGNKAGSSPPAVVQIPAAPVGHLKSCDQTFTVNTTTCKQWFPYRGSENVTVPAKKKKRDMKPVKMTDLEDYVGYLHFEHVCDAGKPRTVKRCLYYKKEDAPRGKPQDFSAFRATHNSVDLIWKPIAFVDQRGFLTHYSLCSENISSKEPKDCLNISASLLKYHLENLKPGAKYNISLAGVTQVGEGIRASITVNTLQEKRGNVWWSLSLFFAFFLTSTMCTIVLKRVKHKICSPVPKPVIPDFTDNHLDNQEMLEEREELHELTLLQPHPGGTPGRDAAEQTTDLRREWDAGRGTDVENDNGDSKTSEGEVEGETSGSTEALRSSKDGETTDLEQADNEIAMLIYRNGLVFDMKADST